MSITRKQIQQLDSILIKELNSKFLHGKVTLEGMNKLSNEAQLNSFRWESVIDKVVEMKGNLK